MRDNIPGKIRGSLKERGILATAGWLSTAMRVYGRGIPLSAEKWVTEHLFDFWNRVDTGGTIDQSDLEFVGDNAEHSNRYVAIVPRLFHRMVESLSINHRQFTFVDIGSGKGRAMILASAWPFRRILGVELSPKLHQIAKGNIDQYKRRQLACRNLRSLWCDAALFPLPPTNLVLYMYNPFREPVMRQVLDNVRRSWEEHPRDIFILYRTPALNDLLTTSGFLSRIHSNEHFSIYHAPARSSDARAA
jgi:SAM-dependent methyltransferase